MTPGQWHRLLPQLWGVCLAAAHSGEGCRCKLEYILYSSLFPAGAAWIMFSWHFHCFQHPPPPSAQWAAQCDAGAQFLHHRQTVQTGGGFSAFDVEFWTCCTPWNISLTFPVHYIHLVLLFFRLPILWEPSIWANGEMEEFVGSSKSSWKKKKRAGFDLTRSKKPVTYVTLHSEEVKVLQLCKKLSATTDKMSNNGGTPRRGQREALLFFGFF